MEIDITSFVTTAETWDFSGSVATHGPNAGPNTWANANREAAEAKSPMLDDKAKLDAIRDWMKETGAWDKVERAAMNDVELNALFIQLVSGDWQEIERLCSDDNGDIDWTKYETLSQKGTISGCLYRGDNGLIYYYLGN